MTTQPFRPAPGQYVYALHGHDLYRSASIVRVVTVNALSAIVQDDNGNQFSVLITEVSPVTEQIVAAKRETVARLQADLSRALLQLRAAHLALGSDQYPYAVLVEIEEHDDAHAT